MHIVSLRGRAAEREAIDGLLARAMAGDGGALLIDAEPGLGKTALLDYATARAGRDFSVLATSGAEDEASLPFAAVHRLLQPFAGRIAGLPPRQAVALAGLLDGAGCAEDGRLLVSVSVLALLARAAAERPVLVTVDDAQWLDPASARLLAFVARRVAAQPVAAVFAGCYDPVGHPNGGLPRLRLAPLDAASSRELLADLVPDGLPAGAESALTAIARGNPQALVDLARSLTSAQRRGDEPVPDDLPADSALRRAYRGRLVRLPAPTRWLLLLAAADAELDTAGLVRAAQASGTDVAALAPAEESGLIRVLHSGPVFTQPLVRAMAYEEAPLAQRRAAHLLLSRTLDRERDRLRRAVHLAAAAPGPDPRLAEELADAAVDAGGYATASTALERAAELTAEPAGAATRLIDAARYAWLAGSPHRARTLLYSVRPVAANRDVEGRTLLLAGEMELRSGAAAVALQSLLAAADKLADGDRHLAIGALMRAGEAVCFCGDHFRYADIERRASVLRRPDEPLCVELMLEHIAGFSATFRGRHEHAVGPLRRVVALAARLDEAAELTWSSAASLLLGDDAGAGRQAGRAVELARAAGDVSVPPRALELKACAEYWLGRYDAAAATSLEGLQAARAGGQDNSASNHLAMLAVLAAVGGDRQSCLRRIHELTVHPSAGPANRPRALREWALAVLDVATGRAPDAVARLTGLADPATGRGHVVVQVMATPYLVEAAARAAERAAALSALRVFDQWASSTGDPLRLALVARCRALLAPRGSGEAEEHFCDALRLHLAGESDIERARTELLFGRELRRCRRPRDAREHLHRALETFERHAARTWIEQTRAELRAAGEPAAELRAAGAVAGVAEPPVPVTDALTAQQLQIAQLVVDGATNREVAAQLLLSTRTVDHHMRNIFSRLGIRSRVELARLLS